MSNAIRTGWTPFKIPPTPTITDDSVYSLTCATGAVSTKNPSQFLRWSKIRSGLPNGTNKGDIVYWDPDKGAEGSWAILGAPQTGKDNLKVLTIKDETLAWTSTEDCE